MGVTGTIGDYRRPSPTFLEVSSRLPSGTSPRRARAERWVADTGTALRTYARRAYVNYLPPSAPERVRAIYGVNYPRLARIKTQYDPANLFRENQNIPPQALYRHKAELAVGIPDGIASNPLSKSPLHQKVTRPEDY